MKVDEVMTKNLVTVSVASMAADAAKKMLSENVGTVLVTDKGQLKGTVTDRQIAARVIGAGKDASKVKVGDFMTKIERQKPVICVCGIYSVKLQEQKDKIEREVNYGD
jgi:CBS domain-containing protein